MPIIYNGTQVSKVVYNGAELDKVVYNDVTVFELGPQVTPDEYFEFNLSGDAYIVRSSGRFDELTSAHIPATYEGLPVTEIERQGFRNFPRLESMIIPDSIITIREYAFASDSSLASVTIGNSVTTIGNNVFENCRALTGVILPDSLTSIGRYAFRYCTGLTSIIIPDRVQAIQDYAFQACEGLTSVVIGSSVIDIRNNAFGNCVSIASITCKATTPPGISSGTFNGVPTDCPIYVPAESVDAYKAATYWRNRANYIQAIPV